MQDLYLKLSIDPAASPEEIATAIKARPEFSAAADILLNGQRRAAYQRTVFTLRSIGTLRHRLGLDKDNSWFLETCADFAPWQHGRKSAGLTEPAALAGTAAAPEVQATQPSPGTMTSSPAASATGAASSSRPWLRPVLIIAVIAALLSVLYSLL